MKGKCEGWNIKSILRKSDANSNNVLQVVCEPAEMEKQRKSTSPGEGAVRNGFQETTLIFSFIINTKTIFCGFFFVNIVFVCLCSQVLTGGIQESRRAFLYEKFTLVSIFGL